MYCTVFVEFCDCDVPVSENGDPKPCSAILESQCDFNGVLAMFANGKTRWLCAQWQIQSECVLVNSGGTLLSCTSGMATMTTSSTLTRSRGSRADKPYIVPFNPNNPNRDLARFLSSSSSASLI